MNALFLELCEVTEVDAVDAEVPIQYQCLECLALFDTPELWLAHRQTHNRSSTHSSLSTDTVSTHTHTHVCFCELWGHSIGVMVFIKREKNSIIKQHCFVSVGIVSEPCT